MSFVARLKRHLGGEVIWQFSQMIFASLLLFLVESFFIIVFQLFLLSVGLVKSEQTQIPEWMMGLGISGLLALICFGFARFVVVSYRQFLVTKIQYSFAMKLRRRLAAKAYKSENDPSVKELSTLFGESATQAGYFFSYGSFFLLHLLLSALLMIYCFFISWELVAIGVLVLGTFVIPLKFFSKRIETLGNEILLNFKKMNGHWFSGIKNHFFFRLYNLTDSECAKVDKEIASCETAYVRFGLLSSVLGQIPLMLGILAIATIVVVRNRYLPDLSAPVLIGFIYLFVRMSQAASEALTSYSYARLNYSHFENIILFLEKEEPRLSALVSTQSVANIQKIQVQDLGFRYSPTTDWVFRDLNFSLKSGDFVLIRGRSGKGKSTLIKNILGVLAPSAGQIRYDESSIPANMGDLVGYSGPEPFIIDGTIADNVKFGLKTDVVGDDRILNSLHKAGLDSFLNESGRGAQQVINNFGGVSTGQAQRISLARIFFKNDLKVIVLDEATSNIDYAVEALVIDNLVKSFPQAIIIAVSHRDTLSKWATKTIDLG